MEITILKVRLCRLETSLYYNHSLDYTGQPRPLETSLLTGYSGNHSVLLRKLETKLGRLKDWKPVKPESLCLYWVDWNSEWADWTSELWSNREPIRVDWKPVSAHWTDWKSN